MQIIVLFIFFFYLLLYIVIVYTSLINKIYQIVNWILIILACFTPQL